MNTTDATAPTVVTTTGSRLLWRVLGVELRDELRAILREPSAIGFSVLMPVAFFALFLGIFGGEGDTPTEVGTTMLATFGTFGVLAVALMNPGIGLAVDRERGWLRVKRAAAVPFPVTVAAKVLASVPYAVAVMVAMVSTAAAMGRLDVTAPGVVRLVVVLVLGSTSFVPFALAVGSLASSNAAAAILNAVLMPMAVASGLWMPLEQLPAWLAGLAPALPAYHLSQLGLAQLDGNAGLDHVGALVVTLVVGAGLFAVAYRRRRP